MKMRALKFVRFDRIEDHFRQGWLMSFPNAPMHHHYYGCELAWICDCKVPGGFKYEYKNRVYVSEASHESAHERHGS